MSDGEISCPKCFNKNPAGAAFCGHCGADMRSKGASSGAEKRTMFGYQGGGLPSPASAVTSSPKASPASPDKASGLSDTAASAAAAPLGAASLSKVGDHFSIVPQGHVLPTGTLHAGQDTRDGGHVAVLLVAPEAFPSPLDMERARRELRQLQKIGAPNLVKILDHGKASDGRLYVVMEPVQGQSLAEMVEASPFALPDAQRIIRGIGVGLSEAQKVGVVHRDIAPHNVLVATDGTVKLLGFGIAALIKHNVFGTPEYISPEQAAGRPVDQRSNIYSLGALMFYMLTGEPPFTGSVDEVLEQHKNAEPPAPKDRRPSLEISPRAEQLIAKALAKSSSRRHLTLRQFLREVDSIDASDVKQVQPRGQTPSFETPLHGVTSLSGGARPPSSEFAALKSEDPNAARVPDPNAPPIAAGVGSSKRSLRPSGAIDAASGASISGELSGGSRVSMKQTDEQPSTASAAAPAQGASGGGEKSKGKGGFRETMWFFKGEIESAMAESGEATDAPPVETTPDDLQDKYRDDGSLSAEGQKLSLRTGNTQMMQAVKIPSGVLPGEKMKEDEFISEMNSGRKIAMVLGILLALGAIGGAVYFFLG